MKYLLPIILLLSSSFALADSRREHMRDLDEDLERLTRQARSIVGETADGERVAAHLRGLEAHLQQTRREICGDCANDLPPSNFRKAADRCVDAARVTSALSANEYDTLMREELPRLHERLHRLTRERFLFEPRTVYERPRLLREYYDQVRVAIDRARPVCGAHTP